MNKEINKHNKINFFFFFLLFLAISLSCALIMIDNLGQNPIISDLEFLSLIILEYFSFNFMILFLVGIFKELKSYEERGLIYISAIGFLVFFISFLLSLIISFLVLGFIDLKSLQIGVAICLSINLLITILGCGLASELT